MPGIMFSILLTLLAFVSLIQSQMVPICTSTVPKPCMVTYTASMPPQIGPVSTVWGKIVTTSLMAIDCDVCDVTNFPANPMPQGPFSTKITIPELTITGIGCVIKKASFSRRDELLDQAASTTSPNSLTTMPPLRNPAKDLRQLRHRHLVKRQSETNDTIIGLSPNATGLLEQLNTALYVIDLINSGANLTALCQSLQDPVVSHAIEVIGLNASQAATIVCFASNTGFSFIQTTKALIVNLAAALYGVEVASNFTGSTDTNTLCDTLNFAPLAAFGVDANSVRNYICAANNVTTTVFTTTTVNITLPSAGTLTPITISNSSGPFAFTTVTTTTTVNVLPSAGTLTPVIFSNSSGPFAFTTVTTTTTVDVLPSAGTLTPVAPGNSSGPFAFTTAMANISVPSAGTLTPVVSLANSSGPFAFTTTTANISLPSIGTLTPITLSNSTGPFGSGAGIGFPRPTGGFTGFGTGIPFSGTGGTAGTARFPLGTGSSSPSNLTVFPTPLAAGTGMSGTAISGTAVSGTAVSGTAVSDSLQINFTSTSYEHSTSSKVPPRPTRYPPYYAPSSTEAGYWCGYDWC